MLVLASIPSSMHLNSHSAEYTVVARLTPALQRLLPGLNYSPVNRDWEMADFQHRPHSWSGPSFRGCATFSFPATKSNPRCSPRAATPIALGSPISPSRLSASGHFYDARAAIKPRIGELLQDYALRKIPTRSFEANALFLEIIRLAYNSVIAFQRLCLQQSWQSLTLSKLRYKLVLLPGEITRPQNRPILRLRDSSMLQQVVADDILRRINKLRPLTL